MICNLTMLYCKNTLSKRLTEIEDTLGQLDKHKVVDTADIVLSVIFSICAFLLTYGWTSNTAISAAAFLFTFALHIGTKLLLRQGYVLRLQTELQIIKNHLAELERDILAYKLQDIDLLQPVTVLPSARRIVIRDCVKTTKYGVEVFRFQAQEDGSDNIEIYSYPNDILAYVCTHKVEGHLISQLAVQGDLLVGLAEHHTSERLRMWARGGYK